MRVGGFRFQVSGQGFWALGLLVQGFKFKVPVETCKVFFSQELFRVCVRLPEVGRPVALSIREP